MDALFFCRILHGLRGYNRRPEFLPAEYATFIRFIIR